MNLRFFTKISFILTFLFVYFSCEDTGPPDPIWGPEPFPEFTALQDPANIFKWDFKNESWNCKEYIWNFDDGSSSTDVNVSHTYSGAGVFNVTLTGVAEATVNATGRRKSITKPIQIDLPTYNDVTVKFSVDMTNYGKTFTVVQVAGNFTNWNPTVTLADGDSDKVWEGTAILSSKDANGVAPAKYEYKYLVDNWADSETLTSGSTCTVTDPSGVYTNRVLEVGNLSPTLDLITACWGTCELCVEPETLLSGSWVVAGEPGGMGVGPSQGDVSWWSVSSSDVTARTCLWDDKFTFEKGTEPGKGVFTIDLNGSTWLEPWQGGSDACGTPIAPHVGGAYAYEFTTSSLKVVGTGAYMGLQKATNTGQDGSATEITYIITTLDATDMILDIESGAGVWWRLKFKKM